jgi:hypothetical protein
MRPRFLVQIYRKSLRDDDREYIEGIASKLPITIKIIDSVGNDVEEACVKLIINLFNWIAEYAELSKGLIKRLEDILGEGTVKLVSPPFLSPDITVTNSSRHFNFKLRPAVKRKTE